MKIAISGAHSTGKSTFIDEIRNNVVLAKNYIFNGNTTRNAKKKGVAINEAGSDESQLLVFAHHLENYIPKNVILDRCALDGLVYTTYLYERKQVSKETLQIAEAIFENLKYDIIFYIKPEFDIVKDGVRSTELEFRDRIVELFDEYIESYRIPVIPLTGSVDERVDAVLATIESYESFQQREKEKEELVFKELDKKLETHVKELEKGFNEHRNTI